MSTFEREGFQWRETYFVLLESARRPSLKKMERLLKRLSNRFELIDAAADDEGRFESLTLLAPDDYAAIDISYLEGDEVTEQAGPLMDELKSGALDKAERAKLQRIASLDARLDLLHFEQTTERPPADEADEPDDGMLDPSALLLVMDALVELTGGVGVDPQSGSLF